MKWKKKEVKCEGKRTFGFAMSYKCYKNEGHEGRCEYFRSIKNDDGYVDIRASWRKRNE